MEIRFFQPEDTETLVDLLHDMSRHYNAENASPREVVRTNLLNNILGSESDVRIVVACAADRAVGVAMISILYPAPQERAQLFMKELYVASDARSKGIGRQLIQWIARYAVNTNSVRFDWTVDADNTRATEFYRSIGATHLKDKLYFRFSGEALQNLAGRRGTVPDE